MGRRNAPLYKKENDLLDRVDSWRQRLFFLHRLERKLRKQEIDGRQNELQLGKNLEQAVIAGVNPGPKKAAMA